MIELTLKIVAATAFFAASLYTFRAWKSRSTATERATPLGLMIGGFVALTASLIILGEELGRCPIINLPQILIFQSWAMVLLYLLVGPVYRISLLGAFSAPLAFVLLVLGLLIPQDPAAPAAATTLPAGPARSWLEFHAAISLIAYGAFALAAVAGLMYLIQDRQLKSGRPNNVFFNLPPIETLLSAVRRLIITGLILLGMGIFAGFMIGTGFQPLKIGLIIGIWLIYAALLATNLWTSLGPRRFAALSMAALTLTLMSLVSIRWLMSG